MDFILASESEDSTTNFNEWRELCVVDEDSSFWYMHFVKAVVSLKAMGDTKDKDKILNLFDLFSAQDFQKLQSQLWAPVREKHFSTLSSQWPLKNDSVRFKSCVGNKEDASAWLEAIPKCEAQTLGNDDFRMACILRLGFRFPEIS